MRSVLFWIGVMLLVLALVFFFVKIATEYLLLLVILGVLAVLIGVYSNNMRV